MSSFFVNQVLYFLSSDQFVFVFRFHPKHLRLLKYFVCVVGGVLFDFRVASSADAAVSTPVVALMALDRFCVHRHRCKGTFLHADLFVE